MQYMLMFTETEADFAKREDPAAAPDYSGAWLAYIAAMTRAGVIVSGSGLQPPATATTLRVRGGRREVRDGPYADAKEQLGGFFVIEVADLDAALDWAAQSPSAVVGTVEVRPVLPPPAAAAAA